MSHICDYDTVKSDLMGPGHNGNLSLAENVYSPKDPNFKYLYETEPACNVNNFDPLRFRYRHVSLYKPKD
jgi:hypothetical protein